MLSKQLERRKFWRLTDWLYVRTAGRHLSWSTVCVVLELEHLLATEVRAAVLGSC